MAIDTVLILSSGHSGSTLLDLLIGGHPCAFSLGEVTHFDEYVRDNRRCSCVRGVRDCPFWAKVIAGTEGAGTRGHRTNVRRLAGDTIAWKVGQLSGLAMLLALPSKMALKAISATSPGLISAARNIHNMYDSVRVVAEREMVVDSSKSLPRFRLLHGMRPERVRAIYLSRDGRGVVDSYARRVGMSAEQAARRWVWTERYIGLMLRPLDPRAWIHIRYEELCRQPEATLRKICRFLRQPYSADMLRFRDREHHLLGGNRMRLGQEDTIRERTAWRQRLTDEELRRFEKIGGKVNRRIAGPHYRE